MSAATRSRPIPTKRLAIWGTEQRAEKRMDFPVPVTATLIGGLMAFAENAWLFVKDARSSGSLFWRAAHILSLSKLMPRIVLQVPGYARISFAHATANCSGNIRQVPFRAYHDWVSE